MNTTLPSVKIYRYLASEWALKSLRERRLRVSRIKELNDPFEWRIGVIAEEEGLAIAGRASLDNFVRVRWIDTRPAKEAFNEVGLFGNQNTVCQPTTPKWRHTVDRLKTVFTKWEGKRDEAVARA